jgi:hypothetical protein
LKNEELLNAINPVLSRLLLHFQFDKPEDGKVDVFDSHYEYNPFVGNINTYLSKLIGFGKIVWLAVKEYIKNSS